ncbi:lipoyl(octanoyl) transferase [Lacibacter cauensis]|uniref:Octanoyltransferase n=1 Tax=Lacibacter cauensis TaxID=510947 RepID=A0A562SUP7_9BACT|nr:lipoyl(octanoyl) transferase LipB [Lacibacter cauensis]TWI84913.1 lipoyl(octanoyl) transferase [Lacibacter cauensis]
MTQQVQFEDLGNMPYKQAWDYQESLLKKNLEVKAALRVAADRQQALTTDDSRLTTQHYLLFVEHPPVYTLGKSGDVSNILISEEERIAKGIEYYPTNRGGDITFHGPQQIVGYPIFDLEKFETDIGKYLRKLEDVIILTMADYGLKGDRSPGETGVWLDPDVKGRERKICAMGVRCSRWITMHGFAFNVNTDLAYFNNIIPCGIQNKQVTSLEKELGRKVDFEEAKERVKRNFEKVFDIKL